VVDNADVENMISQDLEDRAARMGGQQVFQEALAQQGWTPATFREYLRGQARYQQLSQQYMAKRVREMGTVVVEENEIRQFFEEQREAIGDRPPTVTFIQVILVPTPSDSAKEVARSEAERIRQMAVDGDDFGELARRFSQDPGSKDIEGDLGWFRRGVMVDAFEEAAFNLPVNEISQPVESPFGYHVIKVTRRRSGEIRASHILIMVEAGPGDVERARERAQEVMTRLEAGDEFQALREEFGDPAAPDSLTVPFDQLQQLPPGFAEPLIRANPGDMIGPLEYQAERDSRVAVLKVLEVTEGGAYTLEDVELRQRIRETLQQQKIVDQILEELRSKTYVQIRM
jgi:parvulin-like peptidyl-prolyl isomerase